jgi:hypothetical protein
MVCFKQRILFHHPGPYGSHSLYISRSDYNITHRLYIWKTSQCLQSQLQAMATIWPKALPLGSNHHRWSHPFESVSKPNMSRRNVGVIWAHLGLLLELSLRVIAMIRATAVEKLNKTQRRVWRRLNRNSSRKSIFSVRLLRAETYSQSFGLCINVWIFPARTRILYDVCQWVLSRVPLH